MIGRRQVLQGTAATCAGVAAAGAARAEGTGPLRIGLLQELTGAAAQHGEQSVAGAKIAIDDFNRSGGWNGRPAELIVRDDKFNPNDAAAAAREMAAMGINLMSGPSFTGPAIGLFPLLKELNMVMFASGPVTMSMTHELYIPNFFRMCMNAVMMSRGEARVMAANYPDAVKWTGIIADLQSARDLHSAFVDELVKSYRDRHGKEITIIDPIVIKSGVTDFRNAINALLRSGAQGLYLGIFAGDALTFLQQARPFRLSEQIGVIADASLNVDIGLALKKNTPDNIWSSMPWQQRGFEHLPLAQAFINANRSGPGDPVIALYTAQQHAGLTMMLESVRRANSSASADVIRVMESEAFDTIYGRISYRKEDHQILVNPGYVRFGPAATEQGWEVKQFVSVPWQDVIEPATPGVALRPT